MVGLEGQLRAVVGLEDRLGAVLGVVVGLQGHQFEYIHLVCRTLECGGVPGRSQSSCRLSGCSESCQGKNLSFQPTLKKNQYYLTHSHWSHASCTLVRHGMWMKEVRQRYS